MNTEWSNEFSAKVQLLVVFIHTGPVQSTNIKIYAHILKYDKIRPDI